MRVKGKYRDPGYRDRQNCSRSYQILLAKHLWRSGFSVCLAFPSLPSPLPPPLFVTKQQLVINAGKVIDDPLHARANKKGPCALPHGIWVSVVITIGSLLAVASVFGPSCSGCGLETKKAGQCGEKPLCVLGRILLGGGRVGPDGSHFSLGLSRSP